jgi:hypothetical protein
MDVTKGFRGAWGTWAGTLTSYGRGLGCTSRYMDVIERFRVGLGCTGRFRLGLLIKW